MKQETSDATASLNQSTPLGYYKWYPRDFLASSTVRKMSVTAKGVYRCLLDLQWEDGTVPEDYDEACLIIGASPEEAESFKRFFAKCFPNGLNPKLDEQRLESIAHILEQKRRGKAGAEKKARLKDEADVEPPLSHRLATAEPVLNECSATAQPPLSPTTTTTATTTTTIKDKKVADAPSSRKGNIDFLSMAQESGFEDDMFLKAWTEFVAHRREMKHPLTERAADLILRKLKKFSVEVGVEAINRSISSGWRDVFPEKVQAQQRSYGKPSKVGSALDWVRQNREGGTPSHIEAMLLYTRKPDDEPEPKAIEGEVIEGEVTE